MSTGTPIADAIHARTKGGVHEENYIDALGSVRELERENASLREELTTRERLYKEQWQRAEQTEARALANEKDKKQLLTRLVDALESAVDWAGYASEYFREKHQHQLDIDKLDAARDELAAIDAAIGAKHE